MFVQLGLGHPVRSLARSRTGAARRGVEGGDAARGRDRLVGCIALDPLPSDAASLPVGCSVPFLGWVRDRL